MGRLFGSIFILVLVLGGLSLAVVNTESVTLNYYIGTLTLPLSMALVVSLAVGALLGIIVSMGVVMRLKMENAHMRRSLQVKEREVSNLRSLPIKDVH